MNAMDNNFDPLKEHTKDQYEHSQLKYQSDDIESRINNRLDKSDSEQRRTNRIIILISLLTLITAIAGLVLQLAK